MPAKGYTFSDSDLQRIREMLKNDVSQADIARFFSVSPATISRVIKEFDLKVSDKPLTPLAKYLAKFAAHLDNPEPDMNNLPPALDDPAAWVGLDDDE